MNYDTKIRIACNKTKVKMNNVCNKSKAKSELLCNESKAIRFLHGINHKRLF